MKKFRKILKDGASEPIVSVDEKLTKKDVTPDGKGKKRRRLIFKSMFVMSIIFVMISVSYSWFVQSDFAKINGVKINVVDPKNINTQDILIIGQLSPITGDGKNFFVPEIGETVLEFESDEMSDEGEETDESEETVETEPEYIVSGYDKIGNTYSEILDDVTAETLSSTNIKNVRVIQFTLEMEGEAEKLCLMPGTSITPVEGAPSYLVGALRVSFLKTNAQNEFEPVLIWIPDVTSTVDGEKDLEDEYIFVSEEGTATTEISVLDKEIGGVPCVFGPIKDPIALGEAFSGEAVFRCVIWLDGNDRECNSDLIGQQFAVNLNILPEEKN